MSGGDTPEGPPKKPGSGKSTVSYEGGANKPSSDTDAEALAPGRGRHDFPKIKPEISSGNATVASTPAGRAPSPGSAQSKLPPGYNPAKQTVAFAALPAADKDTVAYDQPPDFSAYERPASHEAAPGSQPAAQTPKPKADAMDETGPAGVGIHPPNAVPNISASAEDASGRRATVEFEGPTPPPLTFDPDRDRPKTLRSGVRAYKDGVYTTVSRESIGDRELGDAQAVPLPYSSTDIVGRIGPYDILGELGRGGMGVVYDAYSLRLCRRCAIKVMIAADQASQMQLVRFQNEAMLAARLQHKNIVQVFDAGEEQGQFYFVMEYVDGLTLEDIAAEPSYATKELVRVAAKSAYALAVAHSHGVVHRDVKPENILVSLDGEPHITDFGIAGNVRLEQRITNEGAMMGTPAYMSPEQINGEIARIGPQSDQYSLAATLFHMVAGREPFVGASTIDLLYQALNDEAPLASAIATKHSKRTIDLDLDTILAKGLEKKASDRYESITAFADDLMAYVEDRPIAARPVSSAERLRKLVRRNRAAFVIAAVVFTTLLVVGAAFATVTIFNIERTSETIRDQDRIAGLEQAATLERAIRVNMLQGRADVVRELVNKLREDPQARSINVVRVDRSLAYTDMSTKNQVERRITKSGFIEALEKVKPEFVSKIAEVKRLAFDNIQENAQPPGDFFAYDNAAWAQIVKNGVPVTKRALIDGEWTLTVLKPIENTEDCQVCHGEANDGDYESNHVRAVLVVRRSQQAVEDRISANKATTFMVGGGTSLAILLLVFLFARIFGLRFRRRRYGD